MSNHGISVQHVLGHRETAAKKTCPGKLIDMGEIRQALMDSPVPIAMLDTPTPVDATAMFRHICGIFDDPEFPDLPQNTRRLVMELRKSQPFADLTREDLV